MTEQELRKEVDLHIRVCWLLVEAIQILESDTSEEARSKAAPKIVAANELMKNFT